MSKRPLLLLLFVALLAGCVATAIKQTTYLANVRTTIEPSEVEGLDYLESSVHEYSGSYSARAVQAIIANRYADAGWTDVIILIDMRRQPPLFRTRATTSLERRNRRSALDDEWHDRPSYVTESEPGDWLVEERVYRAEERVGIPVPE